MARILCLASSGFGKTTGTGKVSEAGIEMEGLNPEQSYILS